MRHGLFIGVTLLALSPLAGCDRDQTSSTPAPSATPPATAPAPATLPTSPASADDARQRAAAAESNLRGAANSAVSGAQSATSRAQTQATATAQMTADEAKGMLNEAMTYIKEKKYDLADKALNQVEANKDKLPKAIQDQLANARSALNAAKAGNGLQIPGLGGSK
jgi:hypothetical protein